MVTYLANAFFAVPGKDPRGPGGRVSVPAPVDPETPDVAWWYDHIAHQLPHFRRVGIRRISLPPVCKAEGGSGPFASGYGVYDHYDIGSKNQQGSVATRFGTAEQLQRLIANAHANGIEVETDLVLHQMAGGHAGVYNYVGAPTEAHPNGVPLVGRFPKTPGCFRGGVDGKTIPPFVPQDAVPAPGDDVPFGDEISTQRSNPPRYMIDGILRWLDWYISRLGISGARIDDTKGLWVPAVIEFLTKSKLSKLQCFGEYFDGNLTDQPGTITWYLWNQIRRLMSTLDFPMHWALKDVFDYGHGMWRLLPSNTLAGIDPWRSRTFIDTGDTDNSPGQQLVNNKRLACAYQLQMSPGDPQVYHRDYSTDPGCYGLGQYIDNMIWCRNHLWGGQTMVRHVDNDVLAFEALGYQVGKPGCISAISTDPINHREVWVQTSFGSNQHLHDYNGNDKDIWTDHNGWAPIQIPSNFFGHGNSHVCYGPVGVEDKPPPAGWATTQVFEGAAGDELDIAPARNGRGQEVQRIWCGNGTSLTANMALATQLPANAKMSLIISNEQDGVLGEVPLGPNGTDVIGRLVSRDGWVRFSLNSDGLPEAGVKFALEVKYTGTQGLPPVG